MGLRYLLTVGLLLNAVGFAGPTHAIAASKQFTPLDLGRPQALTAQITPPTLTPTLYLPVIVAPLKSLEQIIFVSERDGNSEIYRIKPNGSGETRLTIGVEQEAFPAWSPDNQKIAFTIFYLNATGVSVAGIFVMNADGSGRTQINVPSYYAAYPDWSPDGKKIRASVWALIAILRSTP